MRFEIPTTSEKQIYLEGIPKNEPNIDTSQAYREKMLSYLSPDFRNFLSPELTLEEVPNLRNQMANNYQAYISETTQRFMDSFGLSPSDVAVVISGGFHMKTSTPKSDIDIDVLQLNPNIEVSEFEKELLLELTALGHSVDQYITKELCNNATGVEEQLMISMRKLYNEEKLGDKLEVLKVQIATLSDIPRDINSVSTAIKENLAHSIGNQKSFLGFHVVIGDTSRMQLFLDDIGNYMSDKSDIDIKQIDDLIQSISIELEGSPVSIITQEPKTLVSTSMKLLKLEYLQENKEFANTYEDLVAFAKKFGEEFVLGVEFFINYRFLMANYKLLDPKFTNEYFIDDEKFLLKIAHACGCKNILELKKLAHTHMANVKSGLKIIRAKIEERK